MTIDDDIAAAAAADVADRGDAVGVGCSWHQRTEGRQR